MSAKFPSWGRVWPSGRQSTKKKNRNLINIDLWLQVSQKVFDFFFFFFFFFFWELNFEAVTWATCCRKWPRSFQHVSYVQTVSEVYILVSGFKRSCLFAIFIGTICYLLMSPDRLCVHITRADHQMLSANKYIALTLLFFKPHNQNGVTRWSIICSVVVSSDD